MRKKNNKVIDESIASILGRNSLSDGLQPTASCVTFRQLEWPQEFLDQFGPGYRRHQAGLMVCGCRGKKTLEPQM
jgi:hypothetical protein